MNLQGQRANQRALKALGMYFRDQTRLLKLAFESDVKFTFESIGYDIYRLTGGGKVSREGNEIRKECNALIYEAIVTLSKELKARIKEIRRENQDSINRVKEELEMGEYHR